MLYRSRYAVVSSLCCNSTYSLHNWRLSYLTPSLSGALYRGCLPYVPGDSSFRTQPIRWCRAQKNSIVVSGVFSIGWWWSQICSIGILSSIGVFAHAIWGWEGFRLNDGFRLQLLYPPRRLWFFDYFLIEGVSRCSSCSVGYANGKNSSYGSESRDVLHFLKLRHLMIVIKTYLGIGVESIKVISSSRVRPSPWQQRSHSEHGHRCLTVVSSCRAIQAFNREPRW